MTDVTPYDLAVRAQATGARPDQSVWVTANAGSGKTKVLIDRVARLLLQGVAPDSILCITYTKAAANEMQKRLFDRLGDWSVKPEEALASALNNLEHTPGRTLSAGQLRDARALFARALETPGGLRIETIHAFCSRILRRFPLEAGISPGFTELEDTDEADLRASIQSRVFADRADDPDFTSAVHRLIRLRGTAGLQGRLNGLYSETDRILQAVPDEAAIADAVLGLADRVGLEAIKSDQEIIADFLNAPARRELWRHLWEDASAVDETGKSDKTLIATLETLLNAAPTSETGDLIQSIAFTAKGELRKANPFTKATAHIFADAFEIKDATGSEITPIGKLRSNRLDATMVAAARDLLIVGVPLLKALRDEKDARGLLGFDDLILKTRDLFRQPGLADWVLYKLDGGLTHVLLDEAQDTSPGQWTLLTPLLEEFFAGDGQTDHPRTQFVVGDEKHSIYSFQGADPDHFMEERRDFIKRQDAAGRAYATPEMQMSFRSAPEILAFVDRAFDPDLHPEASPLRKAPPEEDRAIRHLAFRDEQPGYVELWDIPERNEAPELSAWDAPVDMVSEEDVKVQLAKRVAGHLRDLLDQGEPVWARENGKWHQRPLVFEDILILVQSRSGVFHPLIRQLKLHGLPVAGADRLTLNENGAVQDLLNLIRFVLFPRDDLTVAEILKGPFVGLTDDDKDLFPLAHQRKGTLYRAVRESEVGETSGANALFSELLHRAHETPFVFLSHALNRTYPDGQTGMERLIARMGQPARDPVETLLDEAIGYDANQPASLQHFLASFEGRDVEIKRELSEPDGEIRVMTTHGAKGLEAPFVVLPDTTRAPMHGSKLPTVRLTEDGIPLARLSSGNAPLFDQIDTEAKEKLRREHMRLLYVALTRAESRLLICGHPTGPSPPKGCWFEVCRAAMDTLTKSGKAQPLEEGSEDYAFGSRGQAMGARAKTRHLTKPDIPQWFRQSIDPETTSVRVTAPSRLVPGDAPVVPPFTPVTQSGLRRGTLIHGLLEQLPEIPAPQRQAAANRYLDRAGDMPDAARSDILSTVFAVFDTADFAEVFAPGSQAEVPVVGTVPELGDTTILNGSIDRLVVTGERVLIVDYKSDRPPPARAEDVGLGYLAQLAAYRAILQQTWPDRPVEAALLWTYGPTLMPLPEALLTEALGRVKQA